MKKITIVSGEKTLSFVVSNDDSKRIDKGVTGVRECLTESQRKKLERAFTKFDYSRYRITEVKDWSWTVDEMLDDIQNCGGYDNFGRLTPYEIYQWVKEQYPCTKANGMRVAEICSCGLARISFHNEEFLLDPMSIR